MKKILLPLGALALLAFADARPSAAFYEGAWCAKVSIGAGAFSERCDFMRFEACRRFITGPADGSDLSADDARRTWRLRFGARSVEIRDGECVVEVDADGVCDVLASLNAISDCA